MSTAAALGGRTVTASKPRWRLSALDCVYLLAVICAVTLGNAPQIALAILPLAAVLGRSWLRPRS